jgi:hypothetical protein
MTFGWSSSTNPSAAGLDTILARDSAGVVAQRNGTTAQTFRLYNTYTDASNYERLAASWVKISNVFSLMTEQVGTGTARILDLGTVGAAAVRIKTSDSTRWVVGASDGHLTPGADGTQDLGATGTKLRNGFFGGTLRFGTHTVNADAAITGYITITDAGGTTRKLAVIN